MPHPRHRLPRFLSIFRRLQTLASIGGFSPVHIVDAVTLKCCRMLRSPTLRKCAGNFYQPAPPSRNVRRIVGATNVDKRFISFARNPTGRISNSMFMYRLADQAVPTPCRGLAAARLRTDRPCRKAPKGDYI
jgi:hypothetical protein